MIEFLELCISPIMLPFTMLMGVAMLYWLTFIFGAVSLDTFDIDFDADVDADVDVDGHASSGGALMSFLKLFNVGDVPIMILITTLVVVLWAVAMLTNIYFNEERSLAIAALWFGPNLVISLFVTKVLTTPLRHLFVQMKKGIATRTKIVGKTCIITTSEVTQAIGQAEIEIEHAPPVSINVRAKPGLKLLKGDKARVIGQNDDETYIVVPYDLEKK